MLTPFASRIKPVGTCRQAGILRKRNFHLIINDAWNRQRIDQVTELLRWWVQDEEVVDVTRFNVRNGLERSVDGQFQYMYTYNEELLRFVAEFLTGYHIDANSLQRMLSIGPCPLNEPLNWARYLDSVRNYLRIVCRHMSFSEWSLIYAGGLAVLMMVMPPARMPALYLMCSRTVALNCSDIDMLVLPTSVKGDIIRMRGSS